MTYPTRRTIYIRTAAVLFSFALAGIAAAAAAFKYRYLDCAGLIVTFIFLPIMAACATLFLGRLIASQYKPLPLTQSQLAAFDREQKTKVHRKLKLWFTWILIATLIGTWATRHQTGFERFLPLVVGAAFLTFCTFALRISRISRTQKAE